MFKSRADAEITLTIYRRFPILADASIESRRLNFQLMFMMNVSSHLFLDTKELEGDGWLFDNWAWHRGTARALPLYEAKMVSHYDHRYATYEGASQAQLNKGTLPRSSEADHGSRYYEPRALHWIPEPDVEAAIGERSDLNWFLGWRGIGRASDFRTLIPSVIPRAAVSGKFSLLHCNELRELAKLHTIMSSFVFDYVVRQKLAGTDLAMFIVKQLPTPSPEQLEEPLSGVTDTSLADWVLTRVLELTYTSDRLAPYAQDVLGERVDSVGSPFRWLPERRETLRNEIDAASFHLYGVTRDEAEHVMDSFFVVRKYDERDHGEFRTKRLILETYDAMADAAARGATFTSKLDPPAGAGPRHSSRHEGS